MARTGASMRAPAPTPRCSTAALKASRVISQPHTPLLLAGGGVGGGGEVQAPTIEVVALPPPPPPLPPGEGDRAASQIIPSLPTVLRPAGRAGFGDEFAFAVIYLAAPEARRFAAPSLGRAR